VKLDICALVSPGISLEAGVRVAVLDRLLKIAREKRGDGASLLVLVHVTQFVTE